MTADHAADWVEYEDVDDELITGEAVALDLRPAGFVLRAAGALIDLIVYVAAYATAMYALAAFAPGLAIDNALMAAVATVTFVLCIFVAPVTVEVLSRGRSLGKLAVGARIVRDDGGAIGLRHAAIRGLIAVVEIYFSLGFIAMFTSLLNPRAKRLGDFVAGTYSQHERIPEIQSVVFGVPLPLLEWSRTADVARMPDSLARRISHYVQQAHGLTPETRVRLGRALAHEASIYASPLPEADAELFLAAVAAVRRDREFAALLLEKRRLEQLRPVLTGLPHRFPER